MNRKQLFILLAVFIVVGGLGLYLSKRQSASWNEGGGTAGGKILPKFPMNDVAHIQIQDPHGTVNLAKVDEKWRVKERWDYPASFSEIGDLLRKVWELKSVQSVRVGPSQYARLELISPDQTKSAESTNAGTLVRFKDKSDKNLDDLLLGKKYLRESPGNSQFGGGDFPVGRYVMVPGQKSVWLISEPFTEVEPKPEHWLDKDFIKVTNLRSVSVTSTNATNSWKVVRDTETGPWKLENAKPGEELDTSKTYSIGNLLSSPAFNDVASPQAKPADQGMDHPREATLETFDHFVYHVKVGNATNEDNYFFNVSVSADIDKNRKPEKDEKPEDKQKKDKEFQEKTKKREEKLAQEKSYEKWTYLVSKWTVDALLKDKKDFLAEKKAATNAAPSISPAGAGANLLPGATGSARTNTISNADLNAAMSLLKGTNHPAAEVPPIPGQSPAATGGKTNPPGLPKQNTNNTAAPTAPPALPGAAEKPAKQE